LLALITIVAGIILFPPGGNTGNLSAQAQNDSGPWKQFSSAEGTFSVLMPGTPGAKTVDHQTPAGKIKFHEFTSVFADASYSVGYLDYPDASEDAESVRNRFNTIRDDLLARRQQSRLINEREIKEGAFTGREFLLLNDQKLFTMLRAFLVHKRLYEVSIQLPVAAAFTNGKATSLPQDRTKSFAVSAGKFFASFEVPEIAETMDEFDRAVRDAEMKSPGLQTVVGPCDCLPENSTWDGVLNGKVVHLVTPVFPAIARSAHASGSVNVQVLIDVDGNVVAARAVAGHPLLRAAAEKAARESKFSPTTLEGKPVMVNGVIVYNFKAQ